MDINTIRRLNLNVLLDGFDSQQDFAKAIGTTESYLSQMKRGTSRNIGDRIARKIEAQLQKPKGWMDHPQGWTRDLVTRDIQLPLDQMDEEDIALLRSFAERLVAGKQEGNKHNN